MPNATLLNQNDPIFVFEHMMRHREYFAVMKPLHDFSVLPYVLDPAFDTGEPAYPWNQNHSQAHSDFNAALPPNANNGYTITPVAPPNITAHGVSTGNNQLTLTGLTGAVIIGSTVTGTGIPAGTTIVGQVTGHAGQDGLYVTSQNTNTTAAGTTVTISHGPYQQAKPTPGNTFGIRAPGVLIEGSREDDVDESWVFWNHQEHLTANNVILPLPTSAPTTAGTGPGTVNNISNPWWWAAIGGEVIFPYW